MMVRKRFAALLSLVLCLLVTLSFSEEYKPTHTVWEVKFGCTSDEFIQILQRHNINASRTGDRFIHVIAETPVNLAGIIMNLSASFGTTDQLNTCSFRYDGYSGSTSDRADLINNGFTDARLLFDKLNPGDDSIEVYYHTLDRETEDGNWIFYDVPVVDGVPDLGAVIDILRMGGQGNTGHYIDIIWDNMDIGISYTGFEGIDGVMKWTVSTDVNFYSIPATEMLDINAKVPLSDY